MESPQSEDPDSSHGLLKKSLTISRESEKPAPKLWFSKRFFVAILMFIGTVHLVSLKANLNIAIVAMTSNQTISLHNETIVEKPEFDWDSKTKGFVLSASAYGTMIAALGSNISLKIGGSRTICYATSVAAVMTLLSPIIIRYNFHLYVLVRMLDGACEGFAFVSYSDLWTHWAPIPDRSKLMSIGFCGYHVGSLIIYPICGYSIYMYGWSAAFYVTGGLTLIWCLLWFIFVPNDPASDRWISQEELAYIKENQVNVKRPKHLISVWKSILTSKCVWALWICKFTYIMGKTFIQTCLPMYVKDITNVEIHKIGLLSALPSILSIFTVPLTGYTFDYLQNKKILTPTQAHKTFMCTGYTIGSVLLLSIGVLKLDFTTTMICFMIFGVVLSLNFVMTQIGCICLAPRCASLVAGSVAISFSLASIAGPMFVGFIVSNHSAEEWNLCLSLTGFLLFIGAIIFLLYGSGEPQPWSYLKEDVKCDK